MGYIVGTCPKCGAQQNEKCNAWVYGSPVRRCKKCGSEYFDNRWREVAIDGIDPRAKNPMFYLFAAVGFLIFTILCGLWLKHLADTQGYYPTKLLGCVILGIIGTVGSILVLLRNVTGYEQKENEKYLAESKARLSDPEYVKKLEEYGYNVPDEFKKQ